MLSTPSSVLAYFDALFGTAERGWIALWSGRTRQSAWVPAGKQAAAAVAMGAAVAGHDIYVGVGVQGKRLGRLQRGTAADVIAIPGAWVELDAAVPGDNAPPPDLAPDLDALWGLLGEAPLPPSLVVESGDGLHAYWLFPECFIFGDAADREHAASLVRRWQQTIRSLAQHHGWRVDPSADLARVLRPAGTRNLKRPDAPILVRLALADGPRYGVEDLEARLPDEPPAAASRAVEGSLAVALDAAGPSAPTPDGGGRRDRGGGGATRAGAGGASGWATPPAPPRRTRRGRIPNAGCRGGDRHRRAGDACVAHPGCPHRSNTLPSPLRRCRRWRASAHPRAAS